MQFYFIRHGQSKNNALWASSGSYDERHEDPELTEVGQRQAKFLAQHLRSADHAIETGPYDPQNIGGYGLTHIYSSLMVRAVATGTVVARALGLPLHAWENIHENGGIHIKDESGEHIGQPGRPRSYFEQHYPDLVLPDSLDEAGWWNRPFEPSEERSARARRVLQTLLERHGDTKDRVAIISHGGFYNRLLRAILALPDESNCWFVLNNTAITRIDFEEERAVFNYSNRTDFLSKALIT